MTEQYPAQTSESLPPEQADEGVPIFGHHISRRTGGLILALGALTILVLFFALQGDTKPSPLIKTAQQPTTTPTPFAQSTLTLQPVDNKHSNIVIVTGNNKVTLVHLELSFDPKTTSITTIIPGTFFKNPVTLLKTIDPVKGTISYTLAIQPVDAGISGSGIVASISYALVNPPVTSLSAMPVISPITILPTTVITAEGIRDNVRKL